jgi:hypothetical protein
MGYTLNFSGGVERLKDQISIPRRRKGLSFRYRFQTGYGTHPASYWRLPGILSSGRRRPKGESDFSPPSWTEAKNARSSISTPQQFPWNDVGGCIQKFPDWPPGARTANGTALCH